MYRLSVLAVNMIDCVTVPLVNKIAMSFLVMAKQDTVASTAKRRGHREQNSAATQMLSAKKVLD